MEAMGRAALVSSLVGVILLATSPAAAARAERPLLGGPPLPSARAAALGPASYSGSAFGTVTDDGTVTDESDGLSLVTNSLIAGQFTFTFNIEPNATISGEGEGEYSEATYSADGSWEKGPILCDVPVTGSRFKVAVGGEAVIGPSGSVPLIDLELTLDGAQETSPNTGCGSEFTIYETTSSILSESLVATQKPWLLFAGGRLEAQADPSVSYNEDGKVGTDKGTWFFSIQPSLLWKEVFKATIQSFASAEAAGANAYGAIIEACGSLPAVFEAQCAIEFSGAQSGAAAFAVLAMWIANDPIDRHYTSVAKPLAGHTPRIHAVRGLNAKQAAALNAQLKAQARTVGIAQALATAVNRFGGAALAKNAHWEHKQRAAARGYAGQLASSLAGELADAKRAQRVLADTALHSYKVSAAAIEAFKESISSHGIPHSLAADLADLKIPQGDLAAIRARLEGASPAIVGAPSLLGALDPPALERDARAAIKALGAIASGKE